jgi:hypothetical protein
MNKFDRNIFTKRDPAWKLYLGGAVSGVVLAVLFFLGA